MEAELKSPNPSEDISRFKKTPLLEEILDSAEQLKGREKREFYLPEDVDIFFFIAELGRPARDHEIGGLIDPTSRSTLLFGGFASDFSGGIERPANIQFEPPREKSGGIVEDIMFHTHPWNPNPSSPVERKKSLRSYCSPSPGDINSLLSWKILEEEDGIVRPVISVVSSRGFITIMEAVGQRYDEELLRQGGFSLEQIQHVKELLALAPHKWIRNLVQGESQKDELFRLAEEFYQNKKKRSMPIRDLVEGLKGSAQNLVRGGKELEKLIQDVTRHFPEYHTITYLTNVGFTPHQIPIIQNMYGYQESLYQVTEELGMVELK